MHLLIRLKVCHSLPYALRIVGAVVLTCVAFAARYLILGVTAYSPFTLFYPVVLISALIFGRSAGLVATALSAVMALVFVEPVGSLAMPVFEELVGVSLYIGVSVFTCLTVDWLYRLCSRFAAAHASAEQSRIAAEAARSAEAWAQRRAGAEQ
jgi:K+-sensing histidine kinase KdpD